MKRSQLLVEIWASSLAATLLLVTLWALFSPFHLAAVFFHPLAPVLAGLLAVAATVLVSSLTSRISQVKPSKQRVFIGPVATAVSFMSALVIALLLQTQVAERLGISVSWVSESSPTHILLVVNDDFGDNSFPRPDSMTLISIGDSNRIEFTPILRDWKYSIGEPQRTLSEKYFGVADCDPYCELKDLAVRAAIGESPSGGVSHQSRFSANVIATELGIVSIRVVEVTPEFVLSVLEPLGSFELEIVEPIPVGGKWIDEQMIDVRYYIEPGIRQLSAEDAIWVARARWGSSNEDRVRRQMELVSAILNQKSGLAIMSAGLSSTGLETTLVGIDLAAIGVNLWRLADLDVIISSPIGIR